jgi:hypothetical protein
MLSITAFYRLLVSGQTPDVCPYEDVSYIYSLVNAFRYDYVSQGFI